MSEDKNQERSAIDGYREVALRYTEKEQQELINAAKRINVANNGPQSLDAILSQGPSKDRASSIDKPLGR